MSTFLLVTQASALYIGLLTGAGLVDRAGFGSLTKMGAPLGFGSARQARPWPTLPFLVKAGYRFVQHGLNVAAGLLVFTQLGEAGQIAAIGFAIAYGGMPQDLAFHLPEIYRELVRREDTPWDPFGEGEKQKPWSLHYWPIRWSVLLGASGGTDGTGNGPGYPDGVPYYAETTGRVLFWCAGYTVILNLCLL